MAMELFYFDALSNRARALNCPELTEKNQQSMRRWMLNMGTGEFSFPGCRLLGVLAGLYGKAGRPLALKVHVDPIGLSVWVPFVIAVWLIRINNYFESRLLT